MKRFLALLLLAGCTNTTDPFLTEVECIKSHPETYVYMAYVSNGRGGGSISPRTGVRRKCDVAIHWQVPNPDYRREL